MLLPCHICGRAEAPTACFTCLQYFNLGIAALPDPTGNNSGPKGHEDREYCVLHKPLAVPYGLALAALPDPMGNNIGPKGHEDRKSCVLHKPLAGPYG